MVIKRLLHHSRRIARDLTSDAEQLAEIPFAFAQQAGDLRDALLVVVPLAIKLRAALLRCVAARHRLLRLPFLTLQLVPKARLALLGNPALFVAEALHLSVGDRSGLRGFGALPVRAAPLRGWAGGAF